MGLNKLICLFCIFNFGASRCIVFLFLSLLSHLAKMLYSFVIICAVDIMQAQIPFALRSPQKYTRECPYTILHNEAESISV